MVTMFNHIHKHTQPNRSYITQTHALLAACVWMRAEEMGTKKMIECKSKAAVTMTIVNTKVIHSASNAMIWENKDVDHVFWLVSRRSGTQTISLFSSAKSIVVIVVIDCKFLFVFDTQIF